MIIIQPGEKTSAGDPWELQRRPGPTAADLPSSQPQGTRLWWPCGPRGARCSAGGEGLENSEISWGKWGETMLNQVKLQNFEMSRDWTLREGFSWFMLDDSMSESAAAR